MTRTHSASAAAALIVCAGLAAASPTAFVSNGSTLYRGWGDSYESFELSDTMGSMAIDSDGRMWTTSYLKNRLGFHQLYEVMDYSSASPWLRAVGVGLVNNTTSIEVIPTGDGNERLVGWQDDGNFYTIDRDTGVASLIGSAGQVTASGYDAINDQFFIANNGDPAGVIGTATVALPGVGGFGDASINVAAADNAGIRMLTSGGAVFDGTYYHAFFDGAVLQIGTFSDGVYTQDHIVAGELAQSSTGFAILVPAPGAAAALAAGAGLMTRRRR